MRRQKLTITFMGQTFQGTVGTHVNSFQDEFQDRLP